MKITVVDAYYPSFLRSFASNHPELTGCSYSEGHSSLMAAHFAESDAYSYHLRRLGHDADEIIVNADFLQAKWAQEHGLRGASSRAILAAQIKAARPDVLYVLDVAWLNDEFLKDLREYVRLIVGHNSCPMPRDRDFSGFDLMVSSFPHFVRFFRNVGIPSEYLPLAFDPRVIELIGPYSPPPTTQIAFVGGVSHLHREATELLETLASRLPLEAWGYGGSVLPVKSALRRVHRGEAWGLDMYRILAGARLAINRHGEVSGRYANNLRLFEATGIGTCLVTDLRDNLHNLFDPNAEVVTYSSIGECIEKCAYLLDHEPERAAIARAGQLRTLSCHTYERRMEELDGILQLHLAQERTPALRRTLLPPPSRSSQLRAHLKELARPLPGQRVLRGLYRRLPRSLAPSDNVSLGYHALTHSEVTLDMANGWRAPGIAERQRQVVNLQLRQLYQDERVPVFEVAANAVRSTGMPHSRLVEIGCASGYYYEALSHLLRHKVDYTGLDYSRPLVDMARTYYPEAQFLVGDATALPLASGSYDILLSGTVLLHVPDYMAAVRESARIARRWCVFHRTPVHRGPKTLCFTKFAYGTQVVEFLFSEEELKELFESNHMEIVAEFPIESYVQQGTGTKASTVTYVCRKR